jgi:transcriptional regulator with XRE-family HTH domain
MVLPKLKLAILESGFKQRFVARKSGLSENRLTCAVTGRCQLTEGERERVAEVLGKEVSELFGPADEE